MEAEVRIGIVSDISGAQARVHFVGVDIISDWLPVINADIWTPDINDAVLCIFDGGHNGRGYIIGRTTA